MNTLDFLILYLAYILFFAAVIKLIQVLSDQGLTWQALIKSEIMTLLLLIVVILAPGGYVEENLHSYIICGLTVFHIFLFSFSSCKG